ARRCAHSFVDEALEAPAVEVFADVDVPFAIGREGMRHVQRTAEDTLLADMVDDLKRLTQENPDVVVRAVDHVEESLIRRECEPAKVLGVGAAAALALMTELRQELTLCCEFENLRVLVTISRQPDVVFRIDEDAVLDRRPLIALAGAAP